MINIINKLRKPLGEIEKNYFSFIWFIIKLIFWVLVLLWLTPTLAPTFINIFKPNNVTVADFILFITAAFIIAYTYETQKMKEQIKKQNEIQEKPVLNLYLRESKIGPNIQYSLRLRNVGNGPAYNIKFFGIEADGYTYYPYFDEPNPILEKDGDEKTINLWVATPNGGVESYDSTTGFQFFLIRLFDSSVKQKKYDDAARTAAVFLIIYEGINGKKYYSIFRLYSKIVPLLRVYDLVVEFISSGDGEYNIVKARSLCKERETMKRFG